MPSEDEGDWRITWRSSQISFLRVGFGKSVFGDWVWFLGISHTNNYWRWKFEKEKVLVIDYIKKTMPVWRKKEDLQSFEILEEDVCEDDLDDLEKEARKKDTELLKVYDLKQVRLNVEEYFKKHLPKYTVLEIKQKSELWAL